MNEIDLFGNPIEPKAPRQRTPRQPTGPVRLREAERRQGEWVLEILDEIIPPNHLARMVWHVVKSVDLSSLDAEWQALHSTGGRPTIDPLVPLALWTYAAIDGLSSARELGRRCTSEKPYRWICGGLAITDDTLSDFRRIQPRLINGSMSHVLAILDTVGLIRIKRAIVGSRITWACAQSSSMFDRRERKEAAAAADALVAELATQSEAQEAAALEHKRAARERAVQRSRERLRAAAEQLKALKLKWNQQNDAP